MNNSFEEVVDLQSSDDLQNPFEVREKNSASSSYVGFGNALGADKDAFPQNHPLFEISDLDIIDPKVFKDNVFFYQSNEDQQLYQVDIDWNTLKENLIYYNRVPGRVKIDKAWQVCSLLGWGDKLGQCYFDLDDEEKIDAAGQTPVHFLALHGGHVNKGAWNAETLEGITKLRGCKLKSKSFEPSLDKDNPEGKSGFTNTGCSVMGYAAIAGRKEMIKYLDEKHGISPQEFHDNQGNCLLHYFAKGGHSDLIIDFEDGTIFEKDGGDPMENPDCGYDIDRENKDGCAPLHELLLNGHLEAFKACAKEFAEDGLNDYGKTEGTGMNFCHLACASGVLEAVQYTFKEFKGQRGDKDANGATLGLLGIRSGNKEVVQFLNSKGHGIDSTDARGYGAIEYAIAYDKTHIIPWLRNEYGIKPKINMLQCAIENGRTRSLDRLFVIFKKSDKNKLDLWAKVECEEIGQLFPIQFAKDDHTRKHVATLMVDRILEKKNPFDTKHKLGEWKGNVRETIKVYQEKITTKTSWISKEQVEKFLKKIKHIDKKDHSEEDGAKRLLDEIRAEMIKTMVVRANKDHERRAVSRKLHTDFVGEYMRFLHACYQRVNPEVNLTDADTKKPTTNEVAKAKFEEVKGLARNKTAELQKAFKDKHPEAEAKISGWMAKLTNKFGKGNNGNQEEEHETLSSSNSN